jgi:hypothetical protein
MVLDRLEKALLFIGSAILTNAAVTAAQYGTTKIPISPDISDPNLRALNLEDWEEFRIFYAACLQALNDDQSWPPPQLGLDGVLGTLADPSKLGGFVQNLLPVLAGTMSGPGAAALTKSITGLLASLQPAPAVPPGPPLPNPGTPAAPKKTP